MAQAITAVPGMANATVLAGACLQVTWPLRARLTVTVTGTDGLWSLTGTDGGALGVLTDTLFEGTKTEMLLGRSSTPASRTVTAYFGCAVGAAVYSFVTEPA